MLQWSGHTMNSAKQHVLESPMLLSTSHGYGVEETFLPVAANAGTIFAGWRASCAGLLAEGCIS